jgi:hypothetical protein
MTVSEDPQIVDQTYGSGDDSTRDTAQEQAQRVAGTAKEETAQVLDTAKEQAQAVSYEVRDQARQLWGDARDQLTDHAGSQRDRAVESLRSVSQELSSMAERAESSGLGVQLAREGGELTDRAADFLQQREPGQLLDELRDLARRRPGAFLLGAAAAGLVVGRATRGVRNAHSSDDSRGRTDGMTVGAPTVDASYPLTENVRSTDEPVVSDAWGPGAVEYPAETTPTTTYGTTGGAP